jgi:hypothetical protein
MRISVIARVFSEQLLERNLANAFSAGDVSRVHVSRVELLGTLDDEQAVITSHHNSRMPELVPLEEKRRDKIELERIEEPGACRLVKKNYVAGLQTIAHFIERDHWMVLVSEPAAHQP